MRRNIYSPADLDAIAEEARILADSPDLFIPEGWSVRVSVQSPISFDGYSFHINDKREVGIEF